MRSGKNLAFSRGSLRVLRELWWLLLLGLFPFLGMADPLAPDTSKAWQNKLTEIDQVIEDKEVDEDQLKISRDQLNALKASIRQARDANSEQLSQIRKDLDALGPSPEKDAPAELRSVHLRRSSLTQSAATLDGLSKEADFNLARADRLLDEVSQKQRELFSQRIFSRTDSLFSLAIWRKGLGDLGFYLSNLYEELSKSILALGSDPLENPQYSLAVAFGVLLVLGGLITPWASRWPQTVPKAVIPTTSSVWMLERFATTFQYRVAPALGLVLLGYGFSGTVDAEAPLKGFLMASFSSAGFIYLAKGLFEVILRPIEKEGSLLLAWVNSHREMVIQVTVILTLLLVIDTLLGNYLEALNSSFESIAIERLIFSLWASFCVAWVLIKTKPRMQQKQRRWVLFRWVIALTLLTVVLSATLGYLALAYLISNHLILSMGLAGLVVLSIRVSDSIIHDLVSGEKDRASMISKRLGFDQDQDRDFFEFWLKTGARLFLVIFGLLVFYLVWTIDQREALTRLREVFWDLQLGKLGISPAEIFRAIILFVLVLSGTRLFQQTLDQRVFPKTRLDAGIKNSIRSALGYLGFFLGLSLAISSMGVDLSNLAILAGALSVGIGFGLQNIVNNFVSGLILLIERPIKTGDLISLGDQQGTVKKISVRATEITTGDNASLFVPNSSLISGTVVNRSRNGKATKIVLPVHLAFDTELDQSIEKLEEVIGNHSGVLKSPAPTIHVTAVAGGSVVLDVVIFVSSVEMARNVTSELWRAIIRLFKEGHLSPPRDWLDYRAQGH